jgi:sugar lactone lactonase YvrE
MQDCNLVDIIPVENLLGECILWDTLSQSVWWTDIQGATLFRYWPDTGQLRRYDLPERAGSFGFVANDSRLICAFASGFALYDPDSGACDWLYRPEAGGAGTRFNDGRCDARGRFWAGTMVEDAAACDPEGKPVLGALYWVSSAGHGKALGGITIANSLCWSPDGRTVYFADSPSAQICAYDFNAETATFSNQRVFATTPQDSVPDGSIVDAEGCLWNAQWGGGRVARYSPDGRLHSQLDLPVSQPSCVCLGGKHMDLLFVSTARIDLGEEQLAAQPQAGNVFVFKTPYRGLPEARYKAVHGASVHPD